MRIKTLSFFLEENSKLYKLKDCSLVIDAQNFFYDCYKDSGLRFEFGAECDRYAKYLKDYLSMFKKSNITCYFIFKGGTNNLDKKIQKVLNHLDVDPNNSINPIFMIDIHLQILKEMEFNYFFSEYESKFDCMTLARKIPCSVLSNDIEFPLSGVQYILKKSLEFNGDHISCKLFTLDTFLQKFGLDTNKLALFILLTDENIFKCEKTFHSLFRSKGIPLQPWRRNLAILNWLSNCLEQEILNDILNNTNLGEELVLEELNKVKKIVRGEINSDVAYNYFFQRYNITDWFVSGVAMNNIAKEYVDLCRFKVLFKKMYDHDDFTELSLDIIKYAFDLLTNFKNDGLKFIRYYNDSKTEQSIVLRNSIKTPSCLLDQAIFQNGWDNIRSFGLFQHFILETIDFDCDNMQVPDDAKMLMITLLYIFRVSKSRENTMFTAEMAYGVLLSYVILGVAQQRVDNVRDDNSVSISDCKTSLDLLHDYFNVNDASEIMEENLIIPLKQFQYCLLEMNYLNKLCGSPIQPTIYRKTYNGTFVYKVIYTMQSNGIIEYVTKILSSAPTVLQYFHNIVDIYDTLIQSD